MARPTADPSDALPLSPAVFHILLALADEDRHGYAIMQEVEGRTGGAMRLGPGTLYGAIKRLREQELIEEVEDPAEPTVVEERRRYYRLTALGRRVAVLEAERLERMVDAARAKRLIASARSA
ncbi:MAG TPA: PadR family transcriptional regulator [Longimicrobiales bacterium]|nr:PadR family transcriptional regulator [Longimicrobiales bacterium]